MALVYSSSIVVGTLTYSDPISYNVPPASTVADSIINLDPGPTSPTSPPPEIDTSGIKLSDLTIDGILWYAELPPNTVTPYAVIFTSSVVTVGKTTWYTAFKSSYQLSIFSDTRNDAVLRASIARSRLDKKTISEDAFSKVQTQVGPVRSEIAKGLGLNGVDAWMAYFNLDVFYSRT